MKKCPYCVEDIQDEAIKCKHCGSIIPMKLTKPQGKITIIGHIGIVLGFLMVVLAIWTQISEETSFGDKIIAIFIFSLGLFLSIGCYRWARKKG